MKLNVRSKSTAVAIFFSIIFFDQVTKWIAVHYGISNFCNINGPFGVRGYFSLISIIVLLIVTLLFKWEKDVIVRLALLMIIASGFSNLIDRLVYNCVRDFINLGFWPVFNFADAIITIGAISIIYRKCMKNFK